MEDKDKYLNELIENKEEIVSILINVRETLVEEITKRLELQKTISDIKNNKSEERQFYLGYFYGLKEGMKTSLDIVEEYIEAVMAQTLDELNNLYSGEEENEL